MNLPRYGTVIFLLCLEHGVGERMRYMSLLRWKMGGSDLEFLCVDSAQDTLYGHCQTA
jgi:hypothetical protein